VKNDLLFALEAKFPVYANYTVKKVIDFPSPAGMSLTKHSLAGNNLNFPRQREFSR